MQPINIKSVEHISIAVNDVEVAKKTFSALGFEPAWVEQLKDRGLTSHVLRSGAVLIELIESTESKGSTSLERFLAKNGEGVHHICLEVDSIERVVQAAEQGLFRLVDAEPKSDEQGRRLFIHPDGAHGVLIGLVERHQDTSSHEAPTT